MYFASCRGANWVLPEMVAHLNRLPFFAQRITGGSNGAAWSHAADVREVLNKFMASGDDRVLESHLPEPPQPELRALNV
jgi:hypothetical protein